METLHFRHFFNKNDLMKTVTADSIDYQAYTM